jgi:hypothetical protein
MSKLPQNTYRTARGAQIDMLKIINQNEMTIAVGNMSVNARGDKLGPGGKVIGKRDEIVGNAAVPNQVNAKKQPQTQVKDISDMDPEGDE